MYFYNNAATILNLLERIDRTYSPTEEELADLSMIEVLDLSFKELYALPKSIRFLTSLRSLALSHTKCSSLPHSIGQLKKLQKLNISETLISELPESITQLHHLQDLNLDGTRINALPASFGKLDFLQTLSLRRTEIRKLPESFVQLKRLQVLNLSSTHVDALPDDFGKLISLGILILDNTPIRTIPESIGQLASLHRFSLFNTPINALPESIGQLESLEILDLCGSKLTTLPESIGSLPSLQMLVLCKMSLSELPKSLLDLNLPFMYSLENALIDYSIFDTCISNPGIYIHGLKLKNQPIEVFNQSRKFIIAYYNKKETRPINECKVVFLGDGGVGKTLIIDRLMHNGRKSPEFNGDSTPGISIKNKVYQIHNEKIVLHFWDFGGQAIMHSMHRMFLTNRTLYVIVANARDNKANEQAWYWIRNIKSFANGSPVLLLINQKDQNPSANVNINGLRKEYPQLSEVHLVSALTDTNDVFNKEIRDSICRIVYGLETVHTPFTASWLSLMNNLQRMKNNYITSGEFYKKCKRYEIDDQKDLLDEIISWYQDLGICFYSRRHRASEQYMVLKPKWLLNALYAIVFNGRKYATNGIIEEKYIYDLVCGDNKESETKKVWEDIHYEPNEVQYIINVLLHFELIFRLDDRRFFIPMICDENEPDIMDSVNADNVYHVIFQYDYLPENVLHRLMVRYGYDLNTNVVWKTGAEFVQKKCGWHSIVRIRDNYLDVYVKADSPAIHSVNVYLDMLRESIHEINDHYGLTADEYLTYRRDGKEDKFKYSTLIRSKEKNNVSAFSEVFDDNIRIDEILGIISKPQDKMLEDVIEYMLSALVSMSERCADMEKRKETELTSDFQGEIQQVLNMTYGIQIAREYTMGRSLKKLGETDLYFFTEKEGKKQELFILENKILKKFKASYMQLMGYLNQFFSAGMTLSINKEMGLEEAFDYICDSLNDLKTEINTFAPISIKREEGPQGTKYVRSDHIVPGENRRMSVFHLVLQLYDKPRQAAAKEARNSKKKIQF